MYNSLELSRIVNLYDYVFKRFCCLQNWNRFLLFCFLQNWNFFLLFFFLKNRNLCVKKFLMFKVLNIFQGSEVSRGEPDIECSRVSCFDVFKSNSVCYFFGDSSTTSICSLRKNQLLTPDEVSVNASSMNNSKVIWKLFRKRLVFSSNSCIQLLLD